MAEADVPPAPVTGPGFISAADGERTSGELTAAIQAVHGGHRGPAPIEDVWDACTTAERIGRWLMPVSGDLRRLGGKYQLEGNAGGEIVSCEPPRLLRVTWALGRPPQR